MWALIKKEIRTHFALPIFPIFAALLLFLTGLAFTAAITQASPQQLPEASLRGLLYFISLILLFVSPFLSMKSFSDEKKSGTLELLKTSPLSDWQILLAKYFSLVILHALLLLLTIEYPIFLIAMGDPEILPLILAYVGLFLLGASFLSIGVLMSALTQSQMLAAIMTFISCITFWFLSDIGGAWGKHLSIIEHIHSFALGVFDVSDAIYYIGIICVFLITAWKVLEAQR